MPGRSKDNTRDLCAALLITGDIKLRIAGVDVTVRSISQVNGLFQARNRLEWN